MSRLTAIDPAQATGETRDLLDAIEQTLGVIPNAARINASSPAALKAWLGSYRALAGGQLDAALTFARSVLDRQGGVSDEDVERVRAAGYSDGEIVEIVMNVGLNVLSNYFNKVADTTLDEFDFPRVAPAVPVA